LSEELQKVYFAGGCFWRIEESFDKVNGVTKTTSGYSGGHVENPSYKQVVYEETGHLETVEVIFDNEIIKYEDILNSYFKNIDPFNFEGQFCDKGESYRPAIFYENKEQKKLIEKNNRD
jgi:peptide-methionine (S)-S-oxide reductase